MFYLDDFMDEDFTRDDSDDSDISSLTTGHAYLSNNSVRQVNRSHKRHRRNQRDGSDAGSIGADEERCEPKSPRIGNRSLVTDEELYGSSSPAHQWDDNSNGFTSGPPSDADGSESCFPSSGEVDSPWEPDWDSILHNEEAFLPENPNKEAELREHEDKMMAAAAYKGIFYSTSIQGEDDQDEDPWYPYDPHENQDQLLLNPIEDQALEIEPMDETRTVCYGMIHRVRVKVLSRALDPLKRMQTKQISSEVYQAHNIFLFHVIRQGDGSGFLLHAPTALDTPKPDDLIAAINREHGSIMSETSALCTFNAYSSSTEWDSITNGATTIDDKTHLFVDIVIHGQAQHAEDVGRILDAKRVFLQEPDYREEAFGYKNPHLLDLDAIYPNVEGDLDFSRSSMLQLDINLADHTVDERPSTLKQKIATAFKNTSRAQNLERIKADPRIHTKLKSYQEEGLDFIRQREKGPIPETYRLWQPTIAPDGSACFTHAITNCNLLDRPAETGGGILADEMGLGKTLTMLCAIIGTIDEAREASQNMGLQDHVYLTTERPLIPSRATLVVVPSYLLLNEWKHEIELHCTELFNVNTYHGQGRVGNPKQLANTDIVISTYHTIAHEAHDATSPLWQIEWFRVILDEAHIIRKMSTKLFRAMKKLQAKYRWCLSGTPVQNSPEDLAALVSFIGVSPMNDIHKFRKHIANPLLKASQEGVENLRQLLDSVCLRRTKELLGLPEAIIDTQWLDLSTTEYRHYAHVRDKLVKLINQNASLPKNHKRRYLGVFQLQLQLRRLCNHGTFQKLYLGQSEFDPQQAIAHLKKQKVANCEFCGMKVTGIQGIEEERSGNFTSCGHLLCYKCKPKVEAALQKVVGQEGSFKCSLCPEIITGSYFLSHGDSKRVQGANRQMSAWQYFDKLGCSTKVSAIVNDIENYKTDGKSIVFSCWTRSLDLVGMFLGSRKIPTPFFRIDGTQTPGQRKKILEDFQRDPSVKVLLMTTGTGAFGLNLTVASCVYILEPQWNPMVEYQAIARVLRLGQKRNVRVVRYIMKETVEGSELQPQQLKKLGFAKAGWKESTDSHVIESRDVV